VILGADTRATEDTVVADKNCSKIHYIAPNIYCCGAGENHPLHALSWLPRAPSLETIELSLERPVNLSCLGEWLGSPIHGDT